MIKRMFQLNLAPREVVRLKRAVAIVMLPVLVFYMTSLNLLALELVRASAEESNILNDTSSKETEGVDKKEIVETDQVKAVEAENLANGKIEKTVDNNSVGSSDDKSSSEAKWEKSADGKTATIGPVETGEKYKAPQNDKVAVTFSKLPEKPGNLTIKEIKLSDTEQKSLGALSDTAYDITSDMKNGTFEYDLTLPFPDEKNDGKVDEDNVQVLYTENDKIEKDEMKNISDDIDLDKNIKKSEKTIEIRGLDHFTVFVVVDPTPLGELCVQAGATDDSNCYSTIQEAIDAVSDEETTIKVKAGNYAENPVVDKKVILEAEEGVNLSGSITIRHDDVDVKNFNITNPDAGFGIYATDVSGLDIADNVIHDIGTGLGSGSAQAIAIVSNSLDVSDINIENNDISHVGNLSMLHAGSAGSSAKGIYLGNSTGAKKLSNVTIAENTISDVFASTADWKSGGGGGAGAYGILVNHRADNVEVDNNHINKLEGLWAHGIGLEANTPEAEVTDNTISDLTDHKDGKDAMALRLESNASASSVTLSGNEFDDHPLVLSNSAVFVDGNWSSISADPNTYPEIFSDDDESYFYYGINAFSTIQSAVDHVASGGTVNVEEGTYEEAVTIEKPMTLNGAQAGADARLRESVLESVIPAESGGVGQSAISIKADNVTVDGFTIRGAGAPGNQTWGINAAAGVATSDVYITNTIFQNLFEGLHVQGPDANVSSGMTVDKNKFFEDEDDPYKKDAGIWMASAPSNDLTITNNDFYGHDGGDGGDYAAINIDKSTDLTITGNSSHDDGSFLVLVDNSNVTVSNNTSTNSDLPGHQASSTIFIGLGNDNVTIERNNLSKGYRGVRLASFFGTGLNKNIKILDNTIEDMVDAGILIPTGTMADEATINGNKIIGGQVGVKNESDILTDATRNWWGDQSGPSGKGSGVGTSVSDYVDYSPWCLDEDCTLISDEVYTESDGATLSGTAQDIGVGGLTINDITGTGNIFVAKYENPSDVPGGEAAFGASGLYFNIDAPQATFPINIEINYSDDSSASNYLDENHFLSLYYYKNGSWHDYKLDDPASTVSIDKNANKITASLQHLTPIVPVIDTTAPSVPVLTSPINGVSINDNTPLMQWEDSTDVGGTGVKGYEYQVYFSCSNPSNVPGSCSGPYNYGSLISNSELQAGTTADNTYYWQVRAEDNAGNFSAWSNFGKVTIDTHAPAAPTLISPANDAVNNGNPVELWNSVGDADHYIYESYNDLAGNSRIYSESTRNTSRTVGGNQTIAFYWRVKAVDVAGNESGWSEMRKLTVDNTAPTVPMITLKANGANVPTNGYTSSNSFVFNLSSDSATRFQLKYWNDIPGSYYKQSTPWNPTNLGSIYPDSFTQGEGKHYFSFSACDAAGNCSAYSTPFAVTFDKTAPVVHLSSPSASIISGTVPIEGTVTDVNPDHYYLVVLNNSGTVVAGPGTVYSYNNFSGRFFNWDTTKVADGNYTIQLAARDAAGNRDDSVSFVTKNITVDNTAPAIPQNFYPSDQGYINTHNFTFSWDPVGDPTGPVVYEWEASYGQNTKADGSFQSRLAFHGNLSSAQIASPGTPDNVYYWHVRAIDVLGNASAWSQTLKVTVDNVAPALVGQTIFSGWYNTKPQISTFHYADVNMTDGYIDPTCSITTEGVDQTCSITTPGICDKAGNCNNSTVVSNGANIDLSLPTSIITSPSDGEDGVVYLNEWDGTFAGTASDSLSGIEKVELRIQRNIDGVISYWNGTDWQSDEILVLATGTNSWTYGPLTLPLVEGEYNIESHATDNAGNTENTYKLKIIFDKTIPTVDLSIDPENPNGENYWYISNPQISLNAADNVNLDRIEYQLDSNTGTWNVYASPVTISDGQHIFHYRSIDKAKNISNVGIKNVKVDTRDPDNVKDLEAEYEKDNDALRLSWSADDHDIYKVNVYRGGKKTFSVNGNSRIARNDDNDTSFRDEDVERGEKYFYKFITQDEAGNVSGVKIISIRISEEGEAVLTDEGTENLPPATQSTVLGTQSGDGSTPEEQGNVAGQEENNNQQVAGDETVKEEITSQGNGNWPYYATGGVLVLVLGFWWWLGRRRRPTQS